MTGSRSSGAATVNVLILCTHNSARSVLAEGMLNHLASRSGRSVRAYSAGSQPSGRINALALEALRNAGVDTEHLRSKSWDEFSGDDAPPISIVITVCDNAAAEVCPVFFGLPAGRLLKTHWGYPDPSNAEGGEDAKRRAFELTRQAIGYRMLQLIKLLDGPDWHDAEAKNGVAQQAALDRIGKS